MKKIALAVAVLAAGLLAAWWLSSPRVRIAGEPAPLPRAEADAEFVLPAAFAAASAVAREQGWRGLVVHRHGHRVFEYFRGGRDGSQEVAGGQLAAALLSLALVEPAAVQSGASESAQLVSERIWVPLRAHDAWFSGRGAAPRVMAELDDWMRLGDLILGQGTYHGERIATPDSVRQLLASHQAQPWVGDEPLTARDALWFDLEPGIRLWLAPRRGLAVLAWTKGEAARDTQIPNIISRGLNDQGPAISGGLEDMVPGHQ
jgi:hypothetical protein